MAITGTEAYLKTQILTAPPEKLQLMLYEGAIRFATQAREKIEQKKFDESHELLVRAQNIVMELICGLRPELNASLCSRMAALYSFIYTRLVTANVERNVKAIDDALEILAIQRDTWVELLGRLAQHRAEAVEAVS